MSKITTPQLCELAAVPEKDLHNWLQRLDLCTKYEKPKAGPSRYSNGRFTRDNALEITLIARLVRAGFAPSIAAARIAGLFDLSVTEWAIIFSGETALEVLPLDEAPTAEVMSALSEGEYVYVIIHTAAVAALVDKYFAEVLQQAEV